MSSAEIPRGRGGAGRTGLLAVVHTEEEFDWGAPFSREARGTTHVPRLEDGQAVFERHRLRPLYVVDDPIARDPAAVARLGAWHRAGRAVIGAHLHPWVSPPFDEPLEPRWSYPGNLPAELEAAKIETLTATIEAAFGVRPRHYVAGRYGFGPNTASILTRLGYGVDLSPSPGYAFDADGGPDYTTFGLTPRRLGPLLQIPHTSARIGMLARLGLARRLAALPGGAGRLAAGAMARTRLDRRLRLSPEGHGLDDLLRLTRHALGRGEPFLVLSFHSPSLLPGCTPYVRSEADRARFLATLDGYLRRVLGTGRVVPADPAALVDRDGGAPS
jgi:hypothetical protein